jgi:tRNA threonylcarbamoyladenosine biosynthesis protein TsaE
MAWRFHATDEDATEKLGVALAECLPQPAMMALFGTLGAGKTRLVRAIASGLNIDPGLVTSPTFVLVHEYPGETPLFHFDAYRLRGEEEFWQLGPEDYFGDPHGITVVEWADRVAACLPADRLNVSIEIVGPTERQFSMEAFGEDYERALEHLKRLLVVNNS